MTENMPVASQVQGSSTILTRSRSFKKLVKWAFHVCDTDKAGSINKAELYAGLLLVHLHCAKYAGPAACYPESRDRVDQLFDASDHDNSGGIDEKEFENIMIILCGQITSRIFVYYAVIIFLVPYIAIWCLNLLYFIGVDDAALSADAIFDKVAPSFMQWIVHLVPQDLPEQLISLALFFVVVPKCFDIIDNMGNTIAAKNHIIVNELQVEKKD